MKKNAIVRIISDAASLNVGVYAAHACYFMILAAFPALVLILALLRFTGLQVEVLTELLEGFIPQALMGYVRRIVVSTYEHSSGAILSLSALTALWSASRGMFGIVTGFNAIYEVSEDRGYLYTRAMSLVYTLLFILVLLLTLVVNVFGATILGLLQQLHYPVVDFLWSVLDLRFFLFLGIQTGLFTAMYTAMPNCRNRIRDSLPGAVLASIGWLVFSDLFSLYVRNFPRYSNIYGSVYAVALSMLWMYCCISILFWGAVLNRVILGLRSRKKG